MGKLTDPAPKFGTKLYTVDTYKFSSNLHKKNRFKNHFGCWHLCQRAYVPAKKVLFLSDTLSKTLLVRPFWYISLGSETLQRHSAWNSRSDTLDVPLLEWQLVRHSVRYFKTLLAFGSNTLRTSPVTRPVWNNWSSKEIKCKLCTGSS